MDQGDRRWIESRFGQTNDQLRVYTADEAEVDLSNWYRGRHVILLCNGPSLGDMDLTPLAQPGVMTAGINNGWVIWRPHLWFCVDDPANFIDVGWKDPTITKFAPLGKITKRLKVKLPDGGFRWSKYLANQMPSCFFFPRNERFHRDLFFTQNSVNWGCHSKKQCSEGIQSQRSVMLSAVRLLTWLGFKRIVLVGADFRMSHNAQNYAWKQARNEGSVKNNTKTYAALNERFRALHPGLLEQGIEIYNATPNSGLTAFPSMEWNRAVNEAAAECRKQVDTEGWYDVKLKEPAPQGSSE